MSATTKIEWTDATWGPVTGCTEVSPGCDNCYAKTLAERFRGTPGHYFEDGFDVVLRPDKLTLPFRWRKPRKVFVNSMSDLFHKDVPDEYIGAVFKVMHDTPRHTYQILTKRHGRMRSLLGRWAAEGILPVTHEYEDDCITTTTYDGVPWPLPNVWLGVSVEDQERAELRIPALLDTPAAVRFLSCEPLLGPVDLHGPIVNGHRPRLTYWLTGRPGWGPAEREPSGVELRPLTIGPKVDWVIAGGESGLASRPMNADWARTLRDQCAETGTAFHFKQWGGRTPKLNGRELDGRTHDEFPGGAS
jgi:protein gp37